MAETFPIETDITYSALAALIAASGLETGLRYKITDFATTHFMVDQLNGIIGEQHAAPTGITITPDAVGAHPVTHYYLVFGLTELVDRRSLWSEEIEVVTGDSTTEIIFDCITDLFNVSLIRGTTSGVYNETYVSIPFTSIPADIFGEEQPAPDAKATIEANIAALLDTATVNTGATEPIIVKALSATELYPTAYSPSRPQDIIYFDWNPANFAEDYSFCDIDGDYEAAGTMITGFKGVITRRVDTQYNNDIVGDFIGGNRTRRYKHDLPDWAADTYSVGDYIKEDGYMYRCIANDTGEVSFNSVYWTQLVTLGNPYICESSTPYMSIPVDTSDYVDTPMFDLDDYADGSFTQNVINGVSIDDQDYPTILPLTVFYDEMSKVEISCVGSTHTSLLHDCIINEYFGLTGLLENCKINYGWGFIMGGEGVYSCDIVELSESVIGGECENLTIKQLYNSTIGDNSSSINITYMGGNILPNGTVDTVVRYLHDDTDISDIWTDLQSEFTTIIETDIEYEITLSYPDSAVGRYATEIIGGGPR